MATSGGHHHGGVRSSGGAGVLRLFVLLQIQVLALTAFMLGFFLTRHEVPHISTCQDAMLWEVSSLKAQVNRGSSGHAASGQGCWSVPRYRKLVMVVIDALRFDFAQHVSEEDVEVLTRRDARIRYHLNKLPVVQEQLIESPTRSLLYRFDADPPTTTMQRLKGLTTGSLPTFLDLRKNFQSPAIVEDNLIQQFRDKGLRVVAMGDDTWELLFPGSFNRSFPFPSFNTRDIDTVDHGVAQHLLPELHEGNYDVLIAHYLGVDHVGHTYGPSHPAMERKLDEMNGAIQAVIEALPEDALLVVMGDHGMTDDGNHGGATHEETEAALFLYSAKAPLVSSTEDGRLWLWEDDEHDDHGGSMTAVRSRDKDTHPTRHIAQVDLVPTLSLLLGIPIPYANLGGLVPELFFTKDAGLIDLAASLHANARQVHRYLHKYSSMASLPRDSLLQLDREFHEAVDHHTAAANQKKEEGNDDEQHHLLLACRGFRAFLRHALSLGQQVWTQYDAELMLWGVALLAFSLACLLHGLLLLLLGTDTGPPTSSSSTSLSSSLPWPVLLRGSITGAILALVASILLPHHFLPGNRSLAIPSLVLLTIMLTHLLSSPWPLHLLHRCLSSIPRVQAIGCLTLVVLHGSALFSNSYIEAEDVLYLFFSVTAILLNLGPLHSIITTTTTSGHLLWLLPSLLHRCAFTVKGHGQDVASHFTLLTTVLPMLGLVLFHHYLQQQQPPPPSSSPPARGFVGRTTVVGTVYLAVLLYWLMELESQGEEEGTPQHLLRLWLARAVLFLALPCILFLHPPWGLVINTQTLNAQGYRGRPWQQQQQQQQAALRDLAILLAGPLMLVLGPASPLTMLCMMVELTLLGTAIQRAMATSTTTSKDDDGDDDKVKRTTKAVASASIGSTMAVVPAAVVMFSFVGRSYFYATGHHNQFNRLQYSAAFVGFDDFEFYTGGVLLALNTFGTEVIALLWIASIFFYTPSPPLPPPQPSSSSSSSSPSTAAAAASPPPAGLSSPVRPLGLAVELLLTMSTLRTLLTTVCVTIQRRHLMVWAIFAPKLIFDAALHVVHATVAIVLLAGLTWSTSSSRWRRIKNCP